MALETVHLSNDLLTFLVYETLGATSNHPCEFNTGSSMLERHNLTDHLQCIDSTTSSEPQRQQLPPPLLPKGAMGKWDTTIQRRANLGVLGKKKKKRRRRPKVCKNKEEAEAQRMNHIVVERNRRKQMNEHLSVLKSLMPESYAQRGDQASIVSGAIEYVKELEHLLQSLEAQKLILLQQDEQEQGGAITTPTSSTTSAAAPPFSAFFIYPQYTWSQAPSRYNARTKVASTADIEVTLIESHANLRILSRRSPRQLSKLVAGFQVLNVTVLHLNVTSLDPLVLYSISAKVEEGSQLTSGDDIADATHHMLSIIDEEAAVA